MNNFYDVESEEDVTSAKLNEADVNVIEISEDFPTIDVNTEDFYAVYSIGGVEAGVIKISAINHLVTPSQIRSAINISAGFELCRLCVREALIGTSITDPSTLPERLRAAMLLKSNGGKFVMSENYHSMGNNVTSQSLILGRRAEVINTNVSRRVMFPKATASHLIEMAKAMSEPIMQQPVHANETDRILYMPEKIIVLPPIQQGSKLKNIEKNVSTYGRHHFETLFSKQQDPWKYTSPYEQTKYEFTLSLLPKTRINTALEIACAEGHFTGQLAPLVKSLMAVDISMVALERAAESCKEFDHI